MPNQFAGHPTASQTLNLSSGITLSGVVSFLDTRVQVYQHTRSYNKSRRQTDVQKILKQRQTDPQGYDQLLGKSTHDGRGVKEK